ncbi:alpha-E domain-containing protein [Gemmata sp. JC673]|uniref:Alpha-E domain-containing protein n=1 Tax=Gemmata algarum TaxID=2975278 RepID=A0ABU5FAS2_9BACT|nr:alpha-E domain-containing protein [Gemmata algarum]MDY3562931.1 alpha-E domain-containing protein [Gemmata algarum]
MISRVAEHCFWLARYLERSENTARVLEVNHTLLLDFHVPVEQQWRPALIISGIHDYAEEPTAEHVQVFMTWDRENPFSIASSLAWARENARIIREVISAEMWERMNHYHLWMQAPESRELYDGNRSEFYAEVRRINQLLHGVADATMSHGEAWEFFKLGTYLERASQTARIMDVKYHTLLPKVEDVGSPVDNAHWVAILMSCSGYEPFHKKARATPMDPATAVAEFLIFDEQFPRSIKRCLWECESAIAAAAGNPVGRDRTKPERLIGELIAYLDARAIPDVIREGLHETLTHVVDSVHRIGEAVHATFFAADVRPPGSGVRPGPATATQSQSQS